MKRLLFFLMIFLPVVRLMMFTKQINEEKNTEGVTDETIVVLSQEIILKINVFL